MATDDIAELTKKLADSKVEETFQLSFKGKGLKLDKCDDANEIVNAIENCKTLTDLVLEGNTLGTEAAEAIGAALKKHSEFKRALWSDIFTGRLKAEIPLALKHLGAAMIAASARLIELDLSDNAFGPNGVVGIVDLLKSQTCYTLKELRLNNNGLGPAGGKMLASCLMDCYNSSKDVGSPLALRVFISGRGRLEDEGSIALAKVFKLMGSLQEVAMPQNGINHEGIKALAEAFELNPYLRILNLNDNTFTVTGAKAMAKVLPKLQELEVINFGDCLIRTDGAKAIASALCDRHTSLRELILSGNDIAKSGINAVVEALENKDKLEVLDLNYNQFGEQGLKLLKTSLDTIGRLDTLQNLSDDEGSGNEDEDYDENHEEEDVQEDDEDGVELDDPELQITGKAISPKCVTTDDLTSKMDRMKLY